MTNPADIDIGEIKELSLRDVFDREDTSFTPWLSRPENLKLGYQRLSILI